MAKQSSLSRWHFRLGQGIAEYWLVCGLILVVSIAAYRVMQ
jgi:hypothetical protein